jgi:1-deoxy-D-xylulose-5-phosphate reductoisomerase
MPVVLNAANEVAVQQFLDQRIALTGIWRIVEGVMEQHSVVAVPSLEDIVAADDWARHTAGAVAARVPTG